MATEILVFVPGTLGSELWDGDKKVWPGSLWDAVSGFDKKEFERLLQPNLQPRDIVREAVGGLVDVYEPWIKAFEGIRRGPQQPFREKPAAGAVKTLYVFPYDWRVDLEKTAAVFAAFLDDIVAKVQDADLKLVCHSMGGVIARYYLEGPRFVGRPAFPRISLLVTFGTPHNGATVAYAGVVGLHKTSFLSIDQTRTLANDPRYPSLYQLFPVPTHSFIWDNDPAAACESYQPDAAMLVKRYALNSQGLAAWKSFREGLTGDKPDHVRYFYVIGSRQETLTRLLWTGSALVRHELDDSGDGTVSLSGSMDPTIQSEFVGKSHASLIETKPARVTLAALFGGSTVFAVQSIGRVTLAVRDLVVTTDEPVHVQIEFVPEVARFKGVLRFQRADLPARDSPIDPNLTFTEASYLKPIAIELNGTGITYVNIKSEPLTYRGVYRPVLSSAGAAEVVGPRFVVQQA